MTGNTARMEAIRGILAGSKTPITFDYASKPTGEVFGSNVFSLAVMQQKLSPTTFNKMAATMRGEAPFDPSIADEVADAMRMWAISRGATHFSHIFYPLTGITAEKHDSFFDPSPDGSTAIARFKGKTLIQGEPDASSFPSGGIRATHSARGYTAWDPTSPAYILENPNGATLCIPTSYVSWTGEALDKKTPVLKSMQALDVQARRILKIFGHTNVARVSATAGPEQEYFLVDKAFYYARPDLLATGRTVFGAASPKGQEFEDQYFAVIPDRVMAYMYEVDRELFKLGIPAKTRHCEVAPAQFELAPMFESANVAADHQQLIMTTLKQVAERHGLVCLLHEKPFAGINGSGKHVNWSLGNATQGNLLEPGDTPHENAQFLVFCGAVIRAVSKYAKLLRAVVATAGNDHRLGANEAPPAIISIFLGDQLADVFEQIKAGGATRSKPKGVLKIGVDSLPDLPRDAGDRNRSSPFAFTGNKFEFRAVGANMSISGPLTALNTIMCDSLDYMATRLEAVDSDHLNQEIQNVLQEIMEEHGKIIYNGNNYTAEWHQESERRGLPNLRTTVDALPALVEPEVIAVFEKYHVLSEREVRSRHDIYTEQYSAVINLEAKVVVEMAKTLVYPAAARYLNELTEASASLKAAGIRTEHTILKSLQAKLGELDFAIERLEAEHGKAKSSHSARTWCEKVVPGMMKVREAVDELETIVADDLWPLPTYQEMLFIR